MSLTPMMKHYVQLKEEHADALLFYRLGDFYELFFDDALTISKVLHLTLTKRGTFEGKPIPMAGLPHHCADQYIARLLKVGYSVAVCEQITDARLGPVERAVTRVITPGTLTDESFLASDQASLLGSLVWNESSKHPSGSVAIIELSSGSFSVFESDNMSSLLDECDRSGVKELLVHENISDAIKSQLSHFSWLLQKRPHWEFHPETNKRILLDHFKSVSLDAFGLDDRTLAITSAGLILHYLKLTQKASLSHIHSLRVESLENCILMDSATRDHLELTQSTSKEKKNTLLSLFSPSYTPMGLRLISKWMLKPSNVISTVKNRQSALLWLHNASDVQTSLADLMSQIADLERIISRIAMYSAKPSDLIALSSAMALIPSIQSHLPKDENLLEKISSQLMPFTDLHQYIDHVLINPTPSHMRSGGYINPESDETLLEYWRLKYDSDSLLKELEEKERASTGLNLSIQSNRVHGLYITLSRSLADQVPEHYVRKQTLKNEERYTISELSDLEVKINEATQAMLLREKECYQNLLCYLQPHVLKLKKNSYLLAILDALLTMSRLGSRSGYCLPEFVAEPMIDIKSGRHPILETLLEHVVANDSDMNISKRMMVLTGPNMGGKSTYMRQVAVLSLLSYMGSFIPAESMRLGPIDRIMTRIGARDDINKGRSTFMMEMIETAYILNHATNQSLVLLDEIGRGTSTKDGLSIARAVCRSLAEYNQSLTIFATHYFELTQMEELQGVFNQHVAVHESQDTVTFVHKIMPGGTNQSFGLHVAKLSGIPKRVLDLAHCYVHTDVITPDESTPASAESPGISDIIEVLKNFKGDEVSPMSAHHILSQLSAKLKHDA